MRKLRTLLLALGTGLVSSWSLADTTESQADQHYQQALAAMGQALEALADPAKVSAEELDAARKNIDSNLEKATALGHPAAALYQARLALVAADSDSQARQKACAQLGSWARKGFVAAAVMNVEQCDKAYLRFDTKSPEHQAVLEALAQSLAKNDPARSYYPFPLTASQCFSAGTAQAIALSYEQFRAEAEFILGSAQEATDAGSLRSRLNWLDSAANHGCQMTLDLRPALRKELQKQ